MALSAAKVKVTALSARSMSDGHAAVNIVVEVQDKAELSAVINKLNNHPGRLSRGQKHGEIRDFLEQIV